MGHNSQLDATNTFPITAYQFPSYASLPFLCSITRYQFTLYASLPFLCLAAYTVSLGVLYSGLSVAACLIPAGLSLPRSHPSSLWSLQEMFGSMFHTETLTAL